MSTRARLGIAAAVALLSAVGIGIIVAGWVTGDDARPPTGFHETPAVAPFLTYREVRVALGRRCARVVVADTNARRAKGLRGTPDPGPYAGMLFTMASDSEVAFTMAGVTEPLGITWYSAGGSRVDAARMRPCPRPVACPLYRARRPYRFALEVPAGGQAPVRLAPCAR